MNMRNVSMCKERKKAEARQAMDDVKVNSLLSLIRNGELPSKENDEHEDQDLFVTVNAQPIYNVCDKRPNFFKARHQVRATFLLLSVKVFS